MKGRNEALLHATRMTKQGIKSCQRCLAKYSDMLLRERLARVSREVARLLPLSNIHCDAEE